MFELSAIDGLRHIIVRTLTSKSGFEYTMLVSNISLLEGLGTKTLVEKLESIVSEVRRTASVIEVILPHISALAQKFVECMQPNYEQLSLFTT